MPENRGFIFSGVLHLLVLAAILFGMPTLFQPPLPPDTPIAVQLVNLAPETHATRVSKAPPIPRAKPDEVAEAQESTPPPPKPDQPPPPPAPPPTPSAPPPPTPAPPLPTPAPPPPAPAPPTPAPPLPIPAPPPPAPAPPTPAPPAPAPPLPDAPPPPPPPTPKAQVAPTPPPPPLPRRAPRPPAPKPEPQQQAAATPAAPTPAPAPATPTPAPPRPQSKPAAPRQVAQARPDSKQNAKQDQNFDALLKNLADRPLSTNDTPRRQRSQPAAAQASSQPIAPLGSRLTTSEIDLVKRQIEGCWNVPAGARDATGLKPEFRVYMNSDGTVRAATLLNTGQLGESFFQAAAESAHRALLNPRCQPLKLPPDKFNQWQTFTITFDPKDVT